MRRLAVMVVVSAGLVVGPAGGAVAVPESCRTAPPTTVSPTKSRLWTAHRQGRFVATPEFVNDDGSMWLKAPWFAAGPRESPRSGPRGVLRIAGRRVDGSAPPLRARTRQTWSETFAGSGMWAVVITFPTEGCWTVTGRVERTVHTFRLQVTKAG